MQESCFFVRIPLESLSGFFWNPCPLSIGIRVRIPLECARRNARAMAYDKRIRLAVHQDGSSVATYTYDGDGLKRMELVDGVATTLIWDGDDYLGTKS